MFDIGELAIVIIETQKDKHIIPRVMDEIRVSLFSQEPTFIVVSGEGKNNHLTDALNNGIRAAIERGCQYVFWAHPDMSFKQRGWHIPLMRILDTKPSCLKVCAANSRDPIEPGIRLDQEQSWMMRTADYANHENLWFNEAFQRIGGFEDWYQSWQIITSGYVVAVTSESQVFHAGMQTRKLRDTVQEQQDNSVAYQKLTNTNENPHQWKFFGGLLNKKGRLAALKRVEKQFPEFGNHPHFKELTTNLVF